MNTAAIANHLKDWQKDFSYWYFDLTGSLIECHSLSDVPEEVEDYAKISDAVAFFNKCGCVRRSAHNPQTEFHKLCLEVVKIAIDRYGEIVKVYRGSQLETLPIEDHKILYGATSYDVAAWYGIVSRLEVKGLRTHSMCVSVLSPDDPTSYDEEIIFLPETIIHG